MSLKSSEKTGTNEVTIEFSIDAAAFADANLKAYNKAKKNISIPGFRKGKASKAFIEKYYGESVFYDDALEIAFPDAYTAAVEEAGLDVVDNPFDLDIKSIGKDGVELSCKVTVKPEIEIGEYKGLEAEKETVSVSDNARLVDIDDRAVRDGDIVNINYEGFNEGVPFDGGKAEEYDLTIGSGQFIPGFEEKIIGHSIGEEFDIDVTFPEEYHAEELAGKPVVFKIKINGIKVKEMPELDDDFAKDISEFDTLDELKADIEKSIKDNRQSEADKEFESQLLNAVANTVKGEIPQCMIEKAIDDMINDFDYRLKMQGLDFATYVKYMGMSEESVRDTYKERAEKDVKLMLALEKIVSLENIEATAEEIEEQYNKIADAYGMKAENIKNTVSEKTVKSDIVNKKAVDLIVKNAKAVAPSEKTEEKTEENTEEKAAEEPEKATESDTDKSSEEAPEEETPAEE